MSTMTCGTDIAIYDSLYSSLSKSTKQLLDKLIRTDSKQVTVSMCKVNKQAGKSDCALFAAVYCTSIAHGLDPCTHVYDQQQMRDHLHKCFTSKRMDPFPVLRNKRLSPASTFNIPVYCYCRCADDGHGRL